MMYDIPVSLGKVTSLGGVEACAVVTSSHGRATRPGKIEEVGQ